MKTKLEVAILVLALSVPAFVAGWHWSSSRHPGAETPVKQVIEAIESAARPVQVNPDDHRQTAAIFDSLHERTVASFVGTFNSFGITRMSKAEDMRHTDLWTLHPSRSDGFEVSLIGLDRDTPVRYARGNPEPGSVEGSDPSDSAAGLPMEIFRIQQPGTIDEPVPLDSLDLAGVDQLKNADGRKRAIFPQPDSIVAFGPIHSSASCLLCHDGEAGELLGVFRYTFPIPAQPLHTRLAGNP